MKPEVLQLRAPPLTSRPRVVQLRAGHLALGPSQPQLPGRGPRVAWARGCPSPFPAVDQAEEGEGTQEKRKSWLERTDDRIPPSTSWQVGKQ